MTARKRTAAFLGLFLFGAVLGVAVHLLEKNLVADSEQNDLAIESSQRESRGQLRVLAESDEERALRRTLGFGKGLSSLLEALSDPTTSGFKYLRSDFLQQIPNYSTSLLPPLKERALEEMIRRFKSSDWGAWPKSNLAREGRPSEARTYVDQVFAQNRELGLFLETSALLLYGMYLTTEEDLTYNLRDGFDYIVRSADELLINHQPSNLPAKYLLSYSVPSDPSFVGAFERERSRVVAERVSKHPDNIELNIKLLSSLDGRYSGEEANRELTTILLRVSREGSPRMRAKIVGNLIERGSFNDFFLGNESVKKAAAHLIAVASVDALEQKDLVRSKRLLGMSLTLAQGLKSQKVLLDFFNEYKLGFVPSAKSSLLDTSEESFKRRPTSLSISPLGIVFGLLLAVGAALFWTLFSRRGIRNPTPTYLPKGNTLRIDPELVRSPNLLAEELAKDEENEEPRKVVNLIRQ